MALFEKFRTMQSRLGDQGIIVINAEDLSTRQSANSERYRLQLSTRFGDAVLVDREGLDIEIVGQILEAALVRNLGR